MTRALATLWLVILAAGAAGADDIESSGVRVLGLASREVEPGTFSSLVVELENLTLEPRTVTLALLPPPRWVVVSSARTVRIGALEPRSVPFTVHVPDKAPEDEPHEFTLVLSSPEGTPSFRLPQEVQVSPRPAVGLHRLGSEPLFPGERTRHALRVENAGNVPNLFTLAAESTPPWKMSIAPVDAFLRPGESADVVVEVDVPSRAVPGTLNHLVVIATGAGLERHEPVEARVPIASVVTPPARSAARFRRLPLEVTSSAGRNRRDERTYGLRMVSDGDLGEDRRLLLESDFRSDGPADSRRLALQRSRARLTGPTWEVSAGDVWTDMPDAVAPTVSGRGGRFLKESARWTAEGFLHVARGDRPLPTPTWGGKVARKLRSDLWIDGGLLSRDAELATEPGAGVPHHTFLTLGTTWTVLPRLELRSQAAWSRDVLDGFTRIGRAGDLQADYRGETFQAKARGYAGQPKFVGRIRNERAFLAHVSTSRVKDAVLWTNVDVVGKPDSFTRAIRLAGHFDDPGSELTLDSRLDRSTTTGGTLSARTDLFTVWTWRDAGPVRLGFSGKAGWKRDERSDTRGLLWGGATELVGRLGDVRTSVLLDRSAEYRFSESEAFTSLQGDVSWVPARRRLSLGLNFRSHAADLPAGEVTAGHALRPRAEWRLGSSTRLQAGATFDGADTDFGLREWTFQVVWSGADALPLPWNPGDAQRRGRVFLDVDLDGAFGPRDMPLPGVRLSIDGHRVVSGDNGEFEFPSAMGDRYRLELRTASVPPDLVAADVFPRDVPAAAVTDRFLEIPLVRAGSVAGRVFRDEDRNGVRDPAEPGLPDIRMELVRDGVRLATNLTDGRGDYSFGKVPPGDYLVQVASDWMPPGWEATGRPVPVRVVPDGATRADPVGLAPHRKPILKTFDGASGGG